jgi:hypothetical protein
MTRYYHLQGVAMILLEGEKLPVVAAFYKGLPVVVVSVLPVVQDRW